MEHAGKDEDALMKYLEARKIYTSLVTDHPHWSGNTSRVPSRLKSLDERLRPLCLLHQISPSSVLKDPWAERALTKTPVPPGGGGEGQRGTSPPDVPVSRDGDGDARVDRRSVGGGARRV